MQKILKDCSNDEVSALRNIYKICQNEKNVKRFGTKNIHSKNNGTFEKLPKKPKFQFCSTCFTLLAFSDGSTQSLARISHEVFK